MSIKLGGSNASLKSAFEALKTPDAVAELLDVPLKTLRFYLHRKQNYKEFPLRKKSGGERIISAPVTPLMIIQRKLNQVLHAVYGKRSPVHGFVRERSIRTNALKHRKRNLVLNLDLEDFFPTIHFGRVMGLFGSRPYSLPGPVALVLAQICCHKAVLPVGAPTSPIVANMICAKMDKQLRVFATLQQCTYTRYADDITFSTNLSALPQEIALRASPSKPWVVGSALSDIISKNGFKINASKVRVLHRGSCQEVTGIVTNNEQLNLKREYIRQVRAMLHAWESKGEAAASAEFSSKYDRKQRASSSVDFKSVVRGKIDFIGFIRGRADLIFLKFLHRYMILDKNATFKTITISAGNGNYDVIAETIWLLSSEDGDVQGTAFAAKGYGLLTAAHAVEGKTLASRPHSKIGSTHRFAVGIVKSAPNHDIAQLSINAHIPMQVEVGPPDLLRLGQEITLVGFPRHRLGDGVAFDPGSITQEKVFYGIKHWAISPHIVCGNSGGPVLDSNNRVVGIAVKGQGLPGRFQKGDELSCFIPISALQQLA